jgi:hypothetical protein
MKGAQDWSETLAGYVLGDLSSEEMIQVQQYLAENPAAMGELEKLQTTLALLPLGLNDVEVPKGLKGSILNAASITSQAEPPQVINQVIDLAQARSQPRRKQRFSWTPIAGGIAAALVAALGVQNYQLHQQMGAVQQEIASLQRGDRDQTQMATLAAQNGRTLAMQGSGSVTGAAGKIYIVPQQNRAMLVIDNLPQPPAGKIYHLWAKVNNQKVYCVQFKPQQDGKVVMPIPGSTWRRAVEAGVVLEAEQAGAIPSDDLVMQGQQI